ncbi:serine/threonine-protein kinase haspin homolog [Gastrolobium bilobum]|uniref:serine/threonine-protein kinase haspin homolog n=1 Tax=Gastrolobium bilobum TaxID=150636 RepID=UPI002AB1E9FD|nr:serine/threonine-protein kinase haspin homolog [Gastrolobium bilobum]
MGSNSKPIDGTSLDPWSEIMAVETQDHHHQRQIGVVYRRRNPRNNANSIHSSDSNCPRPNRVSLADPNKRVSWNRSLSTRGRTSIAVGACMVYQPQLKQDKRKGRPAIPKGKVAQPPNFDKEKSYFQEVDAFQLLEESPSPKKVGTWTLGNMTEGAPIPDVCSRLEKWLYSRKEHYFSFSSGSETIVKVGEGTYGEAFKVDNYVCKIVPFDGDFRVNGEVQKKSEELLEEVLLCKTLNQLRGNDGDSQNLCRTFIDSIEFRVCQGPYNAALLRAWEVWDHKHGSENDHPKEFPEKQCYMVFVQEHGGKDLESFVLLNFDEARSLLAQVTAGLAVSESAYEFEHRDLHWGNILVSRSDSVTLQFTLDGRSMLVKTYGLLISIIDFTLSRINTGDRILYFDLSSDPDLFKGPKGDKQSGTYRRMKEVTDDWWEGSFPKTNVLWLIYLVDILLMKKSFERTSKNERDLRSLKKRLDKYDSAKEAILDPFFSDMFVDHGK